MVGISVEKVAGEQEVDMLMLVILKRESELP